MRLIPVSCSAWLPLRACIAFAFSGAIWCEDATADVLASYPLTGSSLSSVDTDLGTQAGRLSTFTFSVLARGNPDFSLSKLLTSTLVTRESLTRSSNLIAFTLTPSAGASVSFDSLTFDISVSPQFFVTRGYFLVGTSVPGFSDVAFFTEEGFDRNQPFTTLSADLTGIPAQTTSVTFRLYVDGIGTASSADRVYVDNIMLHGASIPEPSVGSLMLLGGAVGLASRRRVSGKAVPTVAVLAVSPSQPPPAGAGPLNG
jgi:hypothetical protein